MRKLTQAELCEQDVEIIIPPDKIGIALGDEVQQALTGYIPREQKDGSWKYIVPAYLARQVEELGKRLESPNAKA